VLTEIKEKKVKTLKISNKMLSEKTKRAPRARPLKRQFKLLSVVRENTLHFSLRHYLLHFCPNF
jgi:hypothetical protein